MAYLAVMNARSPIVSEFDTPEKAAAYEKWLNEKVATSLADGRPTVPHDEVIGRARKIVKTARRRKA
ncbi:MAG: stability determinant [Sphingomicrobium sp.]